MDLKKAFDIISRAYLWQKLIDSKENGKLLVIIHKMYQGIKSCISVNSVLSDVISEYVKEKIGLPSYSHSI